MIAALLLTVASPDLAAVDEANLALTQCGFAALRAAASSQESGPQFERRLSNQCAGEIARTRKAIIALETARGSGARAASVFADQAVAVLLANFKGQHALRGQDEAALRAIGEALREEGAGDAQ